MSDSAPVEISSKIDLLRRAAAERDLDFRDQVLVAVAVAVRVRGRERHAERLPAGDDRDLPHRVGARGEHPHQRVARLVVGGAHAVGVGHHHLPLGPEQDFLDRVGEVALLHLRVFAAGGEERGLVDQQGDVGAGRAGDRRRDPLQVDVIGQGHAAGVDLEDRDPAVPIRRVDRDAAVETARPQQRLVEDLGTVGRAEHDHVGAGLEAVHLGEDLVERLLALVVPAREPGDVARTRPSDRVELVDEDDRRGGLFGLFEEIADARGADADDRLDELRGRDVEVGGVGLARDGAREQRLAGSRRPVQQHAVRDARPELRVAVRVFEEVDDLFQLLLGLVDPGDVLEGDPAFAVVLRPAARSSGRSRRGCRRLCRRSVCGSARGRSR